MELFGGSLDLVRLTFLIGAVFALICKKKLGATPGGIVMPGILALALDDSISSFLVIVALSAICFVVARVTFLRLPLRRRWTALLSVSLSVVLGLLAAAMLDLGSRLAPDVLVLSLITPGLFTVSARRYGILRTGGSAIVATGATYLVGLALAALLPTALLTASATRLDGYPPLTLSDIYLVLPVGLAMAMVVYWRFGVRGGGYVVGPMAALIAIASPIEFAMLAAAVVLNYLLIRLVLEYTQIIGLERFVLGLFFSYLAVSVMDSVATMVAIPGYRVSSLAMMIAVAVFTNDLTLQPIKRSALLGIGPTFLVSLLVRVLL